MIAIPSFGKLILLIAIVAIVWYGFRFLGEVDRARRQAARGASGATPRTGRRRPADLAQVEDTVKCRACGSYVPVRSPSRCGRSDCPY